MRREGGFAWLQPHELERARQRFDAIAEGAKLGLAREVSVALWHRAIAETRDDAQAERRFRQLAVRVTAHSGRLQPEVGHRTRVEDEARDAATELPHRVARPGVPGRDTLVAVEARRWESSTLAANLQRTFGAVADDIAIAKDSARADGAEGVAVGEQVYLAPGYYDLTSVEGRERLGHEVAHVLQQRRGRGLPGQRITRGDRAWLEAEADRAGRAFARGKPFAVQGRAPTSVALFKGATPAKPATTTATTLDLKHGGKIERKAPNPAKQPDRAKEQLIIAYGAVQAANPFTVERDDSGNVTKLVGSGKLVLPASRYLRPVELEIAFDKATGTVGAKLKISSTSAIKLGGLEVKGGVLSAGIEHGQLAYALDGAQLVLPKNLGSGALAIAGNGTQEPSFDAALAIHVPKLQQTTMTFHADAAGYKATGLAGVDFKQASGSVTLGLEKVGEDKALWSAAGSVGYTSDRLSGQVNVQYNADGALSGDGTLNFKIADFLTGMANVAIDKDGHVAVNGEIRPPNETQLFPEKKHEETFFHKSVDFPIFGISIPMVGSVGLMAFIEGSMGYRVGVGAGVMRDIVLSGSYSTDPSIQPTFQVTGEIFIPAFAELLISIGGGIKLDAFVADISGGIKLDGRAGFYGGLSVRPTLAYEGGKYRLVGQAILGGDVGLQAQLDAFARLHVGKWMFSWEKEWDWKLGEWDKWLGLHLGMEADLDYTLGQPLSPEIFKLKKPDALDVQGIAKSAVPKDGMPAQGAKGAQHQDTEFHAKTGGVAPAPAAAAKPQIAPTPAGAAGHKNQDTKGKNVKPATPAKKPAPAKPAKGKDARQTGPTPQNHSKPNETKLDAKPIIESFSMHGEPHQLIVQLGPGGHVDMASKRERLSVKVGHAVGKLMAKHAPAQQIEELKAIGALAKNGDDMVAKAKTPDKDGTIKVAKQIAAYGEKWKVHDLDQLAFQTPKALVVKPFHLDKPSAALGTALSAAPASQVAFHRAGALDKLAQELLDKHPDARFDFASATLTLPAPQAAALASATSPHQLGEQLAQHTGVAQVTITKTGDSAATKLEVIGELGAHATLGTVAVAGDEVPKTLTATGFAEVDKISEHAAKELAEISNSHVIWRAAVTDPKQVTKHLLSAHADAHFDPATKNLQLPPVHAAALSAATSLSQMGQRIGEQTGVSEVSLDPTGDGFTIVGAINPKAGVGKVAQKKADELAMAKAAFGLELFSRGKLKDLLGLPERTLAKRVEEWEAARVLFKFASKKGDTKTQYTFDPQKAGTRELEDTPKNRSLFGFNNPGKTESKGIEILNKGLRADAPPGDHDSSEYHQNHARYDSKRPGSAYANFDFKAAVLGHREPGCSGYWNREGFRHTKAENAAWCRNPDNYWGPEHKDESGPSGGSSERYLLKSKEDGLHQDWWYLLETTP